MGRDSQSGALDHLHNRSYMSQSERNQDPLPIGHQDRFGVMSTNFYPPMPDFAPYTTGPPISWIQGQSTTPGGRHPTLGINAVPKLQVDFSSSGSWPSAGSESLVWVQHATSATQDDVSSPDVYGPNFRTQYLRVGRHSQGNSLYQQPYHAQARSEISAGSSRLFPQDFPHRPQSPSVTSHFTGQEDKEAQRSYHNLVVGSSIARERSGSEKGTTGDLGKFRSTARRQQAHCNSEKKRRE
jgi:hypothetical protein